MNEKNKKVLWPELFNYKRLCEIRDDEIGEKAFRKEYMCSPVWSEEAYFKRDELMKVVKDIEESKTAASKYKEKRMQIVAGLDIGKKAHPSHLVIFTLKNGHYTQIYEKFMDGWDYSKQVDFINDLIDFHLIDSVNYDDTRAELEGFRERNLIDSRIWNPIVFKQTNKFDMASNFSRLVNHKEDGVFKPQITLLNRQRQLDSILSVNNDLKAAESNIGHGDAFWSIALAVYVEKGVYGKIVIG